MEVVSPTPDCRICYRPLVNPSIGGGTPVPRRCAPHDVYCTHSRRPTMAGCAHHFCESCYVSWCERGHAACPTCRAPVVAIARDVEYAARNSGAMLAQFGAIL